MARRVQTRPSPELSVIVILDAAVPWQDDMTTAASTAPPGGVKLAVTRGLASPVTTAGVDASIRGEPDAFSSYATMSFQSLGAVEQPAVTGVPAVTVPVYFPSAYVYAVPIAPVSVIELDAAAVSATVFRSNTPNRMSDPLAAGVTVTVSAAGPNACSCPDPPPASVTPVTAKTFSAPPSPKLSTDAVTVIGTPPPPAEVVVNAWSAPCVVPNEFVAFSR